MLWRERHSRYTVNEGEGRGKMEEKEEREEKDRGEGEGGYVESEGRRDRCCKLFYHCTD